MHIIEELTLDMIGLTVSCRINGTKIKKAKIQYEDETFFICQNKVQGDHCEDKLGFKHSWSVSQGTSGDLEEQGVEDLMPYSVEWDDEENSK